MKTSHRGTRSRTPTLRGVTMTDPHEYEEAAAAVINLLPPMGRVAVLGSTSFWSAGSEEVCRELGRRLAEFPHLALLTGGMPGVGEVVSQSFFLARAAGSMPPNVYHVLPEGSERRYCGTTLFAGRSLSDRREILARVARV